MAFDPSTARLSSEPTASRTPSFDPTSAKELDLGTLFTFGSKTGSREAFEQLPAATRTPLLNAAIEYNRRTGKKLQINSAMRSEADQKRLYDETVKAGRPGIGPTGMPVAQPGRSAHGRGVAIDIQQGKDDPIAVGILSQYGFVQPIKNDPVHFEVRGGGEKPRGRIGPQPGGFMGREEGPAPTLADVGGAVAKGVTNVGTLIQPAARGATFGLSVYPEAFVKQKKGETFADALERTRAEYEAAKKEYPGFYTGGELAGGLASTAGLGLKAGAALGQRIGQTAGQILGQAGVAGLGAGTTAYTERPETTLAQAAGQAAVAGGLSAGLGLGLTAFTGIGKMIGKEATTKNINELVTRMNAGDKDAAKQIESIFGKAYKAYSDDLASRAPRMPSKKEPMGAFDFLQQQRQWAKETADLPKSIGEFAETYAKDPSKFLQQREMLDIARQYGGQPGFTSIGAANERKLALDMALNAAKLERQNLLGGGLLIGGGGLVGGLTSALTGGELTDIVGSAVGGAALGAGLRLGGTGLYLSPGAQRGVETAKQIGQAAVGPATTAAGVRIREPEVQKQQNTTDKWWEKYKNG